MGQTLVFKQALRKTAETNANSEVTQFSYDAASDLLTLTDPKTNVTTWNYDIYRRATNKVDATSTTIIGYSYDADNRLTNRWMKATGNTGYSYDAVGDLTNIAYPGQTVRFQYDATQERTNMVDAVGTTAWQYYPGGLMESETGPFSSDQITYTYTNRLRLSLVLAQPTGSWTNTYSYDAANRLSSVTSPSGTFTYSYLKAGTLYTNLALPNTSYISNTFDNVARLTGTYLATNTGTVINSHAYTYNTASQRTQQTRTDGSTVAYTYDPLGQLKTAKGSGGLSAESLGYAYDHGWNVNYLTNSSTTYTFAVNSVNEMTGARGSSFSYDNNGNLTVIAGSVTNGYDKENRLAGWTNGITAATTFVYDGLGRLRKRQEYYWLGSGWEVANLTNYVYDGNLVLQMRENSTPVETFTRGSDLSGTREGAGGIGGLLARTTGYSSGSWSTHNYYHADGNGDITYLELTNQTLGASYVYDPYGNTLSSSGTVAAANLYRFSSKELHVASGMYYYGYRFYTPLYQRWLNRDPVQEQAGINLYAFVANSPLAFWDFFGLCAPCQPGWATSPLGGFSAQDINYAARVIYAEASCNSDDDQLAVASVLRNRIGASGLRGGVQTTLTGAANAPNQFASVSDNTPKFQNSSKDNAANLGDAACKCLKNAVKNAKMAAAWGSPDFMGAIYPFNEFRAAGRNVPPGWTQLGGNRFRDNPGISQPQ